MFYQLNIRIIGINVALYGILALDIEVLKSKNYKWLIKVSSDILALFSTFTQPIIVLLSLYSHKNVCFKRQNCSWNHHATIEIYFIA